MPKDAGMSRAQARTQWKQAEQVQDGVRFKTLRTTRSSECARFAGSSMPRHERCESTFPRQERLYLRRTLTRWLYGSLSKWVKRMSACFCAIAASRRGPPGQREMSQKAGRIKCMSLSKLLAPYWHLILTFPLR